MSWRRPSWVLALALILNMSCPIYAWPPPQPKHAPLSSGCWDLLRVVSFQSNDRELGDQVFWGFHPIVFNPQARKESLKRLKYKFGKVRFLDIAAMPTPRRIWKLLQSAPWKVERFIHSLDPDELVLLADMYMGYERFVFSLINRSSKDPRLGLCEGHEDALSEHLRDQDWEAAFREIAAHGLSVRTYRLLEYRLPILKTISDWTLDQWIRREPRDFHVYNMGLPFPEFRRRYQERLGLTGGVEVDVHASGEPVSVAFINESSGPRPPTEIQATMSFRPYKFPTSLAYDAFSIYLANRIKGLEPSRWFENSYEFRRFELLKEASLYRWLHGKNIFVIPAVTMAVGWVLILIGRAMQILN